MRAKRMAVFGLAICGFLFTAAAGAQVPQHELWRRIHFQAHLTDENNRPVHDVVTSMTFRLYADPVTTQPLWTETHSAVAVTSGLLNVMLGSGKIRSFDDVAAGRPQGTAHYWSTFQNPLYLGLSVGDREEQSPRWQIAPTVYAYDALHARVADRGPNLCPVAVLQVIVAGRTWNPQSGVYTTETLILDASRSYLPSAIYDPEKHQANPTLYHLKRRELEFAWDIPGDGRWDDVRWEDAATSAPFIKKVNAGEVFGRPGRFFPTVRVRRKGDTKDSLISEAKVLVRVKE